MTTGRALRSGVFLLGLTLGGQVRLGAQRVGTVRGVVVDATNGQAVPMVIVSIVGRGLGDTTDAYGVYEITGVPSGSISIQARRIGFQPLISEHYALLPDSVLLLHFELTPQPVSLEGVEVRGEVPEARAAIGAKVLRPQDLPGRGNILSALQGVVAGIHASGRRDDVGIRARQSHASMLFVIDGTVVTPPLTFYIDTQDVECVEVRRGYRAAQEFRPSIRGEMYSGVILIWTRGSLAPQPRECGLEQAP